MGFSMDLPDVEAVKEEVKVELAPKPETEDKLEKIADNNTQSLFTVDLGSLEGRREIVSSVRARHRQYGSGPQRPCWWQSRCNRDTHF